MSRPIFKSFNLLALALCFAACAHAAEPLRIGGGSAPMENIFKRIKPHFEAQTGITLELVEEGPVEAYKDLLFDKIDVASAGMIYAEWTKQVDPNIVNQFERKNDNYRAHIVGSDYVTVYTHPGVAVTSLTKQQVKDIFSGKLTNWKQVGGNDLPITVILGKKVSGLMSEFKKKILEDANFTDTAVYVNTAQEMKATVKATRGGVSIGTLAQIQDKTINTIRYPAPQRFITMLWKWTSPKKQQIDTLYQYLWSFEAKKYTLSDYKVK